MASWDGIEEVVAVDTAGSFSAAALALGVSASHVSRAVARLESDIQAQVFNRTTRRVSLTDVGRIVVDQFRRIIQERDEILSSVSAGSEPQGEVRITCATTLGERFVVPIVRNFARENPRVSISIELSNRVVDLVAEGFDLAIRTGHLADSRLITTRIGSRGLSLCASPDYIESRGSPQSVAALAAHDCLIGSASTWHFTKDGDELTYRPKGRWRCNSGIAITEAALSGMGICQLPDFYVAAHLRSGALVALLEDVRTEDEPIWAVYPHRRHLLPKVRGLVDKLRSDLGPTLNASKLEQ
jgi:DNA-binding transcriptional LysR family regulator